MGRYINHTSDGAPTGTSALEKLQAILEDGGEIIKEPTEWKEGLVCIVDNGIFGAALWAYDEHELSYVLDNPDPRPKTWVLYPNAKDVAQ